MEDLSESHLRQLVDNQVREGTDLDYKKEKIGSQDWIRRSFCVISVLWLLQAEVT